MTKRKKAPALDEGPADLGGQRVVGSWIDETLI